MTIVKVGSKYRVLSEKTHRNMGTYPTRNAASNRLKQIEMFKNVAIKRSKR